MDRHRINRIAAVTPIVMSLAALVLVLVSVFWGGAKRSADEGAAAHLFQLLVLAQAPLVLLFLATADWGARLPIARPLVLQASALGLAFGSVAIFNL